MRVLSYEINYTCLGKKLGMSWNLYTFAPTEIEDDLYPLTSIFLTKDVVTQLQSFPISYSSTHSWKN